ncbi:hypothetical protein D1P53_005498 [Cryptococcus gattii VGV]|nr:hypothetical protein D1P53_005498 [Cryptococcus gattii VGV]
MGKPATFTLNWGIISAGGISTCFAQDLVDAATPNIKDVNHKFTAVDSRANGVLDRIKARAAYEEMYNDPDVTVVYVGTPHVLHHRNAKDALWAGKHVLENPACLEVEELDELIKIAMRISRFFMDNDAELCGLGSSLSPNAVEEVIKSGILAKPRRFSADSSMDVNLDASPDSSGMINPALGGSSLLDMSAYHSVWAMLLVHRHP